MERIPHCMVIGWIFLAAAGARGGVRVDVPAIRWASELTTAEIAAAQEGYGERLAGLEVERERWSSRYREASTAADRSDILEEARQGVWTTLTGDVFPAWFGTTWAFHGVSQTPGEGAIACGYFVTTTLRQCGFRIDRVKLAQQPSQAIIRTLADRDAIRIRAGRPVAEFLDHLRDSGPGLYIVGLDQHTGFVVHDGRRFAFVHSSYYRPPFAVTAEPVEGVNPLADSNYRMVGKVLGDGMMRKWLLGEAFPMRK